MGTQVRSTAEQLEEGVSHLRTITVQVVNCVLPALQIVCGLGEGRNVYRPSRSVTKIDPMAHNTPTGQTK